jgi:ABC-type branched-subunit amino acid transport system ATPase component
MKPSTDMPPILSVRNLSTGYGKRQVLFDVHLDVMFGDILLIAGGNGSGNPP